MSDHRNADDMLAAARAAHLDRNFWQKDEHPTYGPQTDCAVDPATGDILVRADMIDRTAAAVFGYHQYDSDGDGRPDATADMFRVYLPPERVESLWHDPAYQAQLADIQQQDGHHGQPPIPGAQFAFDPVSHQAIPNNGTWDFSTPGIDFQQHHELDVRPHDHFGGAYHDYGTPHGSDLRAVDDNHPFANTPPCEHGEFPGVGSLYDHLSPPPDMHGGPVMDSVSGSSGGNDDGASAVNLGASADFAD